MRRSFADYFDGNAFFTYSFTDDDYVQMMIMCRRVVVCVCVLVQKCVYIRTKVYTKHIKYICTYAKMHVHTHVNQCPW